jgi:hypothetical protein
VGSTKVKSHKTWEASRKKREERQHWGRKQIAEVIRWFCRPHAEMVTIQRLGSELSKLRRSILFLFLFLFFFLKRRSTSSTSKVNAKAVSLKSQQEPFRKFKYAYVRGAESQSFRPSSTTVNTKYIIINLLCSHT